MSERWTVSTAHWDKVVVARDKEELDARVEDLLYADAWNERVDEDGACWVWVTCDNLLTGEHCSCEMNLLWEKG